MSEQRLLLPTDYGLRAAAVTAVTLRDITSCPLLLALRDAEGVARGVGVSAMWAGWAV